jgi:hypothetical protein
VSKSTKTPKPDLYLVVNEERRDGYFHLHTRVGTARFENGDRVPYGVDDDYSDGILYSNLRMSCQGDDRTQRATDTRQAVYGYGSPEYRDHYKGDLRSLKRMVKTLEKIERGMNKLTETRGYQRSYGEYLGRVAEVLGCKGFAFKRSDKHAARSGYQWRWTTIGDGVNEANNAVWQWQQEAVRSSEEAS